MVALYSAIEATVSLIIAALSMVLAGLAYFTSREALRSDVPMLQVTTTDRLDSDGYAAVQVHVANVGKRPTTLVGVGVHFDIDPRGGEPPMGSILLDDPFGTTDQRELTPGQIAH